MDRETKSNMPETVSIKPKSDKKNYKTISRSLECDRIEKMYKITNNSVYEARNSVNESLRHSNA